MYLLVLGKTNLPTTKPTTGRAAEERNSAVDLFTQRLVAGNISLTDVTKVR